MGKGRLRRSETELQVAKKNTDRAFFIAGWVGATVTELSVLYTAFAPEAYREPPAVRHPVERILSKGYEPPFVIDVEYLRRLDERDARIRRRYATASGRSRREAGF